jgi:threonine dehydratase
VIVAEALIADCLYRSARSKEGDAVAVGGDLQTVMAGLACGEANSIGWKLLRDYANAFASCLMMSPRSACACWATRWRAIHRLFRVSLVQ